MKNSSPNSVLTLTFSLWFTLAILPLSSTFSWRQLSGNSIRLLSFVIAFTAKIALFLPQTMLLWVTVMSANDANETATNGNIAFTFVLGTYCLSKLVVFVPIAKGIGTDGDISYRKRDEACV